MRPTQSEGLDPNITRVPCGCRPEGRRGAFPCRRARRGHAIAVSARTVNPSSQLRRGVAGQTLVHHAPAVQSRASEALARRVLIAIRVAMGLMFVACGLGGFTGFTPAQAAPIHDGAMALGSALLLAGSLLPLLKGSEVIVETVLDLQRALGTRRTEDY